MITPKPSERILDIFSEMGASSQYQYIASIVQFLDEEWEREKNTEEQKVRDSYKQI